MLRSSAAIVLIFQAIKPQEYLAQHNIGKYLVTPFIVRFASKAD